MAIATIRRVKVAVHQELGANSRTGDSSWWAAEALGGSSEGLEGEEEAGCAVLPGMVAVGLSSGVESDGSNTNDCKNTTAARHRNKTLNHLGCTP